jgi:hypothetical protein
MFTSPDIVESINSYLAIITDPKALQTCFSQGNYFYYDYKSVANRYSHIHAYPGIYNDQLYFFMVPAEYDNPQSLDILSEHTQCCLVVGGEKGPVEPGAPGTHRIPDNEALERIIAWEDNYMEWIPKQVDSKDGIFQAFNISTQDFESENDAIFLGLKQVLGNTTGFVADLIVANNDQAAQAMVFDDFIKSVPPFGTVALQEKFFLLNI